MSRSTGLFAGIFASFAVSSLALVLIPQAQLGGLQPHYTDDEGKITDLYPVDIAGVTNHGREVYIREGCISCHSQQVRDSQNGTDTLRGWGARRSVARDYIYTTPSLIGSQRIGPDLSNTGWADWRNEDKNDTRRPAKRDAAWHLLHLYNPTAVVTESNHPPYRYLFDERKISGQTSDEALKLTGKELRKEGTEVVPTPDAKALVSYLLSLDRSHELAEAKGAASAPAASAPAAAK